MINQHDPATALHIAYKPTSTIVFSLSLSLNHAGIHENQT